MKVEVQFLGNAIDTEVYEAEWVSWKVDAGYVLIFLGPKEPDRLVAAYPEHRIVRLRII